MNNNKQVLVAHLKEDLDLAFKDFQDLNHFLIKEVEEDKNNHLVIYLKNLKRCLEEVDKEDLKDNNSNKKDKEKDKIFQYLYIYID